MRKFYWAIFALVQADLPIHCDYAESNGIWEFDLGTHFQGPPDLFNPDQICGYDKLGPVSQQVTIELSEKSGAKNLQTGTTGHYTTFYDEGFVIYLEGRSYFVHYHFDRRGYRCDLTSVGYLHDDDGKNWYCIRGTRISKAAENFEKYEEVDFSDKMYRSNHDLVKELNSIRNLPWTATTYAEDETYTLKEHFYRSGGKPAVSRIDQFDSMTEKIAYSKFLQNLTALPESLDWRNYNRQNYITQVQDQGACGSCFAFATAGLFESRVRILSDNKYQPIISETDIKTCGRVSTYNQGCNGGWNLLTGKYGKDFGFVEESCRPYKSTDFECLDVETLNCQKWYVDEYEYLGGFYGATIGDHGEAMVRELQNGPVAVGFEVDDNFRHYKSGVFVSPGKLDVLKNKSDEFNPIVPVNHMVLVVGYGVCGRRDPACNKTNEGMKYWIVKNSWGKYWGEEGYFKIIRGVNDLGIESMPVRLTPILPE